LVWPGAVLAVSGGVWCCGEDADAAGGDRYGDRFAGLRAERLEVPVQQERGQGRVGGFGGAGVGRAASSVCRGPAVRRSCVPVPCRVMTPGGCGTGRRRRACGAGKPGGRAVSVTAPIPAVRGQVFSCPWLSGSRGARTCRGRRRPQTCLCSTYPLVSAFDSGRRRAVCKTVGSAYVGSNPTPATTCENGPLAGISRLCGPFFLCLMLCHLVAL
jgi:hypothetical protein